MVATAGRAGRGPFERHTFTYFYISQEQPAAVSSPGNSVSFPVTNARVGHKTEASFAWTKLTSREVTIVVRRKENPVPIFT